MCTVTFLPKGPKSFILTSNRDETPARAAIHPAVYQLHDRELYFPKDPLAGGTWIVTDRERFTLCLLNGAFELHERKPPYSKSRGQMVLDFFKYAEVSAFLDEYHFAGIEPFTLVLVDSIEQTRLTELVWDGQKKYSRELNAAEAYIWSSATLYPREVADQRRTWFSTWLKEHPEFHQSDIIDFHKYGGRGDLWNDFVMKRGDHLQTVSITSIEKDENYQVVYEDLLAESVSNFQ
jgi:uncharacterized protein with NRDE domain